MSSVITYLTVESAAMSPATTEKPSRTPVRRSAFSAASFPRFLSYPIHAFSRGFHRRGR